MPGEVRQVELYLVPALVQSHRHRADERLHPGGGLVVAGSEPSPHVLVVQDLDLECEVLLHVLDNHHEGGQLDAQSLLWICWTCYECCAHICPNYLQHKRLKQSKGFTFNFQEKSPINNLKIFSKIHSYT